MLYVENFDLTYFQRSAFGIPFPSQSRNDSFLIPNLSNSISYPDPEFFKLNPKYFKRYPESGIPTPNTAFPKLNPESRTRKFKFQIPNPNPESRNLEVQSDILIPTCEISISNLGLWRDRQDSNPEYRPLISVVAKSISFFFHVKEHRVECFFFRIFQLHPAKTCRVDFRRGWDGRET